MISPEASEELETALQKCFEKLDKILTPMAKEEIRQTAYPKLHSLDAGIGTILRLHFLKPHNLLFKAYHACGISDRHVMTEKALRGYQMHLASARRRECDRALY